MKWTILEQSFGQMLSILHDDKEKKRLELWKLRESLPVDKEIMMIIIPVPRPYSLPPSYSMLHTMSSTCNLVLKARNRPGYVGRSREEVLGYAYHVHCLHSKVFNGL